MAEEAKYLDSFGSAHGVETVFGSIVFSQCAHKCQWVPFPPVFRVAPKGAKPPHALITHHVGECSGVGYQGGVAGRGCHEQGAGDGVVGVDIGVVGKGQCSRRRYDPFRAKGGAMAGVEPSQQFF